MPVFNISFLAIAKGMALVALGLYIIFAGVVVKQVQLMVGTIEVGLESEIKLLAFLHLALSIGVFILALIIL